MAKKLKIATPKAIQPSSQGYAQSMPRKTRQRTVSVGGGLGNAELASLASTLALFAKTLPTPKRLFLINTLEEMFNSIKKEIDNTSLEH